MITLLYHARTIGYICNRIARMSDGAIQSLSDRGVLPAKVEGTLMRWDSRAPLDSDTTINSAEAVKLSRNKRESRLKLGDLSPTTWVELAQLQFPCIVRPKRHYAAQKFFVVGTIDEAKAAIRACGRKTFYASPVIAKVKEYRAFVLNGEVVKMVRRHHDDPAAVAWNIANGGKSTRLLRESWPPAVVEAAINGAKALDLGWAAADIIVDADDKPWVLELNTAPGVTRDKTLKMLTRRLVDGK